jgi:hypothetical protein
MIFAGFYAENLWCIWQFAYFVYDHLKGQSPEMFNIINMENFGKHFWGLENAFLQKLR